MMLALELWDDSQMAVEDVLQLSNHPKSEGKYYAVVRNYSVITCEIFTVEITEDCFHRLWEQLVR